MATSSDIFEIFTIPFVEAPLDADPLQDLNSIVISQKLARQLFPGGNAVGRELEGLINNREQMLTVSGVYDDFPRNSTLQADCMLSGRWTLEPLNQTFGVTDMEFSWTWDFWNTWILLSEDADAGAIDAQFEDFEKKYIDAEPLVLYSLQNLPDVYLRSTGIANSGISGDLKNIRLFSTVALLILLIAAINYIILSIAVSSGRAKEIGIRKTAGATMGRIRNQVLGESVMLALLVLPLALFFMWMARPAAEELFQASLEPIRTNMAVYLLFYLLITVFIGIASGLYASSYLSRLKVVNVLRQKVSFGRKKGVFRTALIVVQLLIFCSFVSGTLIIRSQYRFAMTKDPGYYNHDILQIELGRDFTAYDAFLSDIRSLPEVMDAAGAMDGLPMRGWMTHMEPHFQDRELKVKVEGFAVDYGLLETLGLTLQEGRYFSPDYGSDLHRSVILNETAVRELGIEDPLGRMMQDSSVIIGVVKDFNLHSIHTEIPPLDIHLTDRYLFYILVHYRTGSLNSLLAKLEEEWKKVEPDRPLAAVLIEELFEEVYASERNLTTIFSVASLFTLLIASFGLFGLTLFMARSRTHEIGIRKTFGSSERAIVVSFLRSNFLMVALAAGLSVPVTLYFMGRWLHNFSYRTNIGWWVFLLAFGVAALVVLLTVSIHAFRASRVNPVDALRYE